MLFALAALSLVTLPVAGLAAGLGLAALASHFGFGEELASFMMMALLAFVVIAAVGFFMRKRAAGQQPALAGAGAGVGAGHRGEQPAVRGHPRGGARYLQHEESAR